jgi:hypothetical protein
MSQPSGLAFCKSNRYLYGISDHGNAISQMDQYGNVLQQLWFSPKYLDIEAVGCDDDLKLLYIASEGHVSNQPINQSINQSTNQPINQSTNQ